MYQNLQHLKNKKILDTKIIHLILILCLINSAG